MSYRKKLIEVALPLEAINVASAREKSIRHGHPSTLHLWWARRPLAACRAVLFASLIDDPDQPGVPQALLDEIDKLPGGKPTDYKTNGNGSVVTASSNQTTGNGSLVTSDSDQSTIYNPQSTMAELRRQKLFLFIEKLVQWENSNNKTILDTAHRLIMAATDGNPPPVLDPFAGGGSIPLEAQRLGLEAHASDLNPVAVLINKALIEIPPKFANMPPVNPEARAKFGHSADWKGATGLAEDVRYYGKWMRDEAFKRIGHLYPKVQLPKEQGGGEATVIAWLWARTVKCPNPACSAMMPLVRSFAFSTKKGKEARIQPTVDRIKKTVQFEVYIDDIEPAQGTINRRGARCIICNSSVPLAHVRAAGQKFGLGTQLIGIVAEGQRGRTYLSPSDLHANVSTKAHPSWQPEMELPNNPRDFKTPNYGLRKFSDLFTARQLLALTTFTDLVTAARNKILTDSETAVASDKNTVDYANAVTAYLGLSVSRSANTICSLAVWSQSREQSVNVFSRQALPMNWDFPEVNPFAQAAGDLGETIESISKTLIAVPLGTAPYVLQRDAASNIANSNQAIVATDPPYYDNISYADLSDFFYIWLRPSLVQIYPELFSTLATPKENELIANPYRFEGDKEKAKLFFENGLSKAFVNMHRLHHSDYPLTVYYAFKQVEEDDIEEGASVDAYVASTGWETMLEGLLNSGFSIDGTWPVRTERPTGVKVSLNALASSIVLVCRPRPKNAPIATRREFINALKQELPRALRTLQHGNIAPVDLAQASIGPGMAIFSRYSKVIEVHGTPMRVRTALQLINQALDEVLTEQEGEYDADTRWAVAWFEQFGQNEGPYGVAETLSKAKNTSIKGLTEAGVVIAKGGKVRLLRRDELPAEWSPYTDSRITVWEAAQHLIHALDKTGESGAADLLAKLGDRGEIARDLAYRLYTTCERKGWAQEALSYNSLVVAWTELSRLAATVETGVMKQATLL
jgi:putative DNA methylase